MDSSLLHLFQGFIDFFFKSNGQTDKHIPLIPALPSLPRTPIPSTIPCVLGIYIQAKLCLGERHKNSNFLPDVPQTLCTHHYPNFNSILVQNMSPTSLVLCLFTQIRNIRTPVDQIHSLTVHRSSSLNQSIRPNMSLVWVDVSILMATLQGNFLPSPHTNT